MSKNKSDKKGESARISGNEPADVARVMRKEALKNTGKDPTFRIYRGWKFGLSYGPVPTPTREQWVMFKDDLMKRLRLPAMPSSYEDMLESLEKLGKIGGVLLPEWIFSASLHPRGRSSVEADWHLYGQMLAAVGAPKDSLVTPIETTHPNAVHYAIWHEVPAPRNPAEEVKAEEVN